MAIFPRVRHDSCITEATRSARLLGKSTPSLQKIMKPLIAIASSLLLCSCADMYVTKSQVGGSGAAAPTDTKDFGSHVRMITANCGVGAYNPRAIYIRPFCVDTAKFTGDQAQTDGEMPIRKALAPVEFAEDLKEQLEIISQALHLTPCEKTRIGGLVAVEFYVVVSRRHGDHICSGE